MPENGFIFVLLVDCEWDKWRLGDCSKECGGGIRINTRAIKQKAEHGGVECPGSSNVTEICNIQNCPGKFFKCLRSFDASI